MSEEWGPWIEHDGKGCPCMGHYVRAQFSLGEELEAFIPLDHFHSDHGQWDWSLCLLHGCERITRYCIRKPKGLTILEGLLEDLPEEVTA